MGTSLDGPSSVPSQASGQEAKTSVRYRGGEAAAHRQPVAPLREGDIVRGTVLEVLPGSMARIELPSGVVEASIPAGQLYRGDVVMFRVQTAEPRPVLQVHAVAGGSTEQHESDIARIFGLSANPVTLETVRTLRRMKPVVTALDIQEVLRGLSIPPGAASLREQIEIISKMRDAGIPVEQKFYTMMESLFVGGRHLKQHVEALRTAATSQDGPAGELLAALAKPFASMRDALRRLSLSTAEGGLYALLGSVLEKAETSVQPLVHNAARGMMEVIEAQQLYNIFALQHHAALVFHVVVPLRGELIAGRLEIEAGVDGRERPQAFRITTEMSALGEVTASGVAVRKMLALTLLADTPEDAEFIDRYRDELTAGLHRTGFTVQSLYIRSRQDGDEAFPRLLQHVNLIV